MAGFHAGCCVWYLAMYKGVVADLPGVPCLVYIACDVCNNFAAQAFWDAAGTVFGVSQAKRFFGAIGVGGTVGNLFVGFFLMSWLQERGIESRDNLLITASLSALLVALFLLLALVMPAESLQRPERKQRSGAGEVGGGASIWGILAQSRYIQHLCAAELFACVARVLIDYQQLAVLSTLPSAEMQATRDSMPI